MFCSFFSNIPVMNESLLSALSTISYIAIITIFLFAMFFHLSEKRKEEILLGKKKPVTFDATKRKGLFMTLKKDLYILLDQREHGHMLDVVMNAIMVVILASFIFLLLMEQPVLAIAFPYTLYHFIRHVILISTVQVSEKIEEELPLAIDHMVRVASKTDSLKTIFFETSKRLEGPLGKIFEEIALKLSNTDVETLLLEFSNEYNSIWVYNFAFTVINFTKQLNKNAVLENLVELRNMLEAENQEKKIQKTEKKYAVMLNYTVAAASMVGFFANVIFNPIAKTFFFGSVMGLGCLMIGFGALFATVLINIRLVRSKK